MSTSPDQDVRYEPDEQPPLPLTIGFGLQYAVLTVAGVVLSPAILVSTVGGSEAYLAWVVFGALLVSGVTTVIQAARVGRIGSGYLLLMGSSSAYLAICVAALERGGGGLLGSLIIVSSLFQFMLAAKLSLFRRNLHADRGRDGADADSGDAVGDHRAQADRSAGGSRARGGAFGGDDASAEEPTGGGPRWTVWGPGRSADVPRDAGVGEGLRRRTAHRLPWVSMPR